MYTQLGVGGRPRGSRIEAEPETRRFDVNLHLTVPGQRAELVVAALGYGVGARWKSPLGPLGIDLAYGQRVGKLRVDFSLAVPF